MMMSRLVQAQQALFASIVIAVGAICGTPSHAIEIDKNSVLTIPARAALPMTEQISMGSGKSILIQFPFELKDVLIADPTIVDAVVQSADRVFLIAKGRGHTNAFFFDQSGEQVLTLKVLVDEDKSELHILVNELHQALGKLLPGSNIKVEIVGRSLILTGSVRTPLDSSRAFEIAQQFADAKSDELEPTEFVEKKGTSATTGQPYGYTKEKSEAPSKGAKSKVINLLSVEGEEQVMLQVTVAEVQRSLMKQFGINLGAIINSGNFQTTVLTENALPLTAAAGLNSLPTPGVATAGALAGALGLYNGGPESASRPFANSGADIGYGHGDHRLTGAIRALERDGLLRTLAEPNLTAVSGESAKFLAGGEFPIPVVDNQGQISVIYKEFGVGVAFTPVVLSEGRISLKIDTEVSELTNQGAVTLSNIQIPALKKRQARSTVELPSGGSLVLAGLLSEDTRQNIDGVPGLKDVPILGTLFRSRDFLKQETELVVLVTPFMVKPTARQNLARPLDGLVDATDLRGNLMGHFNRIYGRAEALPPGGLKGDYGFIVE